LSKSTLSKHFDIPEKLYRFDITILDNPFLITDGLAREMAKPTTTKTTQTIYLPLYSVGSGEVEKKSGLNQWNASGRKRNADEVYIPIPSVIHKYRPSFLPPRKTPFILKLPDGRSLTVRVCQENDKALMSDPNKDLGRWLLRDVLKEKEGELITMEKLNAIGIDSVRIDKLADGEFEINFARSGSYTEFASNLIS
jgi:hypothetical protein